MRRAQSLILGQALRVPENLLGSNVCVVRFVQIINVVIKGANNAALLSRKVIGVDFLVEFSRKRHVLRSSGKSSRYWTELILSICDGSL